MCVIDLDDDCSDVWNETPRKARKAHKCYCCRRQIQPGETYIYHSSLFDGHWTWEKCCAECEADRVEFAAAHGGARMNPGSFPEMVNECISEGDEEDSRWVPMLERIRERGRYGDDKQSMARAQVR